MCGWIVFIKEWMCFDGVCVCVCFGTPIIAIVYWDPDSVSCFDLLTVCQSQCHLEDLVHLWRNPTNKVSVFLQQQLLIFSCQYSSSVSTHLTQEWSCQLCSHVSHLDWHTYIINKQFRAAIYLPDSFFSTPCIASSKWAESTVMSFYCCIILCIRLKKTEYTILVLLTWCLVIFILNVLENHNLQAAMRSYIFQNYSNVIIISIIIIKQL